MRLAQAVKTVAVAGAVALDLAGCGGTGPQKATSTTTGAPTKAASPPTTVAPPTLSRTYSATVSSAFAQLQAPAQQAAGALTDASQTFGNERPGSDVLAAGNRIQSDMAQFRGALVSMGQTFGGLQASILGLSFPLAMESDARTVASGVGQLQIDCQTSAGAFGISQASAALQQLHNDMTHVSTADEALRHDLGLPATSPFAS